MKLLAVTACLVLVSLSLSAGQSQRTAVTTPQTAQPKASPGQADTGDRVFAANCSRCHAAPMSLSPRITGTVIMHMRVRARLSKRDEQLLLKYLAP